jgi:hypothetical protein
MREVASQERVDATLHQVELGEREIVQVGVHLVARPCQVHEVEQRVESYDQECNVSIWKSADQHIQETI